MSKAFTDATAETYATQKNCRTAAQLVQRAVRAGRQYGGIDHSCSCRAASGPLLIAYNDKEPIDSLTIRWKDDPAVAASDRVYLSAERCGVKVEESSSSISRLRDFLVLPRLPPDWLLTVTITVRESLFVAQEQKQCSASCVSDHYVPPSLFFHYTSYRLAGALGI